MPTRKLNSIDDYELMLSETIEKWSQDQRTAFAAAMAERWLPAYEAFSEQEEWGDAAGLRRSLEAVWGHLQGERLGAVARARHVALIRDRTPHMDDFDAEEALAACVMLQEAVECCRTTANHNFVVQAALSGFQAVMPDWELDPDEQPRLWKKSVVRKELGKQLKLLDEIGAIARFDANALTALRQKLSQPELAGEPTPRSEPEKPVGYTNQAAFEQHRRMVEADIKSAERTPQTMDLENNAYLKAIVYFSKWAGRYGRRRRNNNGEYARLADTRGHDAVVARLRALDATIPDMPGWDEEVVMVFEQCMKNVDTAIDVGSLSAPHSYGPSLRRLWTEAKRQGKTDDAAWQHILDWARHRPAAWATADLLKKKGRAQVNEVGQRLGCRVEWSDTGDTDHPWAAAVDGQQWQVGVNDFPEDFMYSLVIDGEAIGDFHDWPETWQR